MTDADDPITDWPVEMLDELAEYAYHDHPLVTFVDHPDDDQRDTVSDPNAPHGINTADEMDGR